jgi:trigger factor
LIDAILGWRLSLERVGCVMADQAIPTCYHPEGTPLMSSDELEREGGSALSVGIEPDTGEVAKSRLDMTVEITDAGPCKKHIKVSIPRSEIEQQYTESLETLRKEAVVPGFRPGKAPRQLVIKRFRKEVADQVKSKLLMSSLEQLDQDYHLEPITQPQLDLAAIELPDDGPMNYEMDVEVRPQFNLPNYKGLALKRPVRTITDSDVETQLRNHLERHGQVVPKLEGGAALGDYLTADLVFLGADGRLLTEIKEFQFRLEPEMRFDEGTFPDLGAKLEGVKPGETRQVEARMGSSARDPQLRGATLPVKVVVHDLKQVRLPEMNEEFLNSIGFESVESLREAVREILNRRLQALQRQALRRQVLDHLLRESPFELPADLVSREEANTVRRLVRELRQEGFTDEEIRAREAEIKANAHQTTLQSLKEFLILAKVAEVEEIKPDDSDVEEEIEAIAEQSGESVRRVRARLEKEGATDDLTTRILERKVIDYIIASSTIEDVSTSTDASEGRVETVDIKVEAEGQEPGAPEATTESPTPGSAEES